MSFEIVMEMNFLFATILLGMVMTFWYDCLRIIRVVFVHKSWIVSIEDLLYCLGCFIFSFMLLYRENNGMIRWFSVMGVALGMVMYKITIGSIYIRYMTRLLCYVVGLVKKFLFLVSRPTRKIYGVANRNGRNLLGVMKKKVKVIRNNLVQRMKVLKLLVSHK